MLTTATATTTLSATSTVSVENTFKDTAATSSSLSFSASSGPTTKSTTQPRLLYRGSLSLPDSHLLLNGLTFTIALPADDPHAGRTLLETPLPLALESMRGRPSLRFGGIVKMVDVHCDFSERVNLHVHPRCILTRQLFEDTLCATSVFPTKGHTDYGIRITLGDASSTNTNNDIVVFGRPHPSASIMQLCVARILPPPPKPSLPGHPASEKAQQLRPPRPDDPIPRKPPARYAGIARIGLGLKRTASTKLTSKEEQDKGDDSASANKRVKKDKNSTGMRNNQGSFKIPALPSGKARSSSEADVFDAPMGVDGPSRPASSEAQNKMFIKKAVVRLMGAAGISKTNPSFRDFFNQVYHGTSFALRGKVNTVSLDSDPKEGELVDRIAQAHITLYLGGSGVGVMLLQQG